MNNQLTADVMKDCVQHGGNHAAKIKRALQMMRDDDFETWADAFSIYASWKNKRVRVDDAEWIPPLGEWN